MSTQTSERLIANVKTIIDRWEERAKFEVKVATKHESLLLRNHLNEQLLNLAFALKNTINQSEIRVRWHLDEGTRLGKSHGLKRAEQATYTIDQLIFEFHILRQVIFEVMEKDTPLTNIEREIIICSIEQSVNDAATEFAATQTKIRKEFVHTLIHDLRGPATAAKMIAQQLQRKCEDDKFVSEMGKKINKNMDRLDLMIQDLLDFERLRAGEQLHLEFLASDLNVIIAQIVEDLNFIYNDRFKYISSGQCLGLWSEKGIKRLVENLAINAVKYGSPETDITISLDSTGDDILFSVHNEGAPIPLKDQASLFEQYRRPRTSDDITGWGLGLTIVREMALTHKASVEVESNEQKGTTFLVKFPKPSAFSNIQRTQCLTDPSLQQ